MPNHRDKKDHEGPLDASGGSDDLGESGAGEDSVMSVAIRRGVSFLDDDRGMRGGGGGEGGDRGGDGGLFDDDEDAGSDMYDDESMYGEVSLFSRGYLEADGGSIRSVRTTSRADGGAGAGGGNRRSHREGSMRRSLRGSLRGRSGGHGGSMRAASRLGSSRRGDRGDGPMSRSVLSQSAGVASLVSDNNQNSLLAGLNNEDPGFLNAMFRRKSMQSIGSRTSEQASDAHRLLGDALEAYEDDADGDAQLLAKRNTKEQQRLTYLRSQIPLYFVMGYLEDRLKSYQLFFRAALFIPFLIMFGFFTEFRVNSTEQFYFMTEAVRQRVERSEFPTDSRLMEKFRQEHVLGMRPWLQLDREFADIGSAHEWRNFLADVVLQQLMEVSGEWTPQKTQRLYYSGAVRIRTIRVREYSGSFEKALYPPPEEMGVSDVPAQNWARHFSEKVEMTDPSFCSHVKNPMDHGRSPLYRYVPCDDIRGSPSKPVAGYHCGGYMMAIPFNDNGTFFSAVMSVTQNEGCGFVDNYATRFAAVEYFVYSPPDNAWMSVKYVSQMEPSGWFRNTADYTPFRVWTSSDTGELVFSIFFFLYLIAYLIYFIVTFAMYMKRKHYKEYFLNFWNLLDAVIIIISFVAVGFYFRWVTVSKHYAEQLRIPMAEVYPAYLDQIAALYDSRRIACCINIILLLWRLLQFTYFFNPLRTLLEGFVLCFGYLCGVTVVYFVITLGYALAGWAVFGANNDHFSTIAASLSLLMRLPVETRQYYPSEVDADPSFTSVFFISYYVLVYLCSSSLIMAVCVLSYQKISRRYWMTYDVNWVDRHLRLLRNSLRLHHIKTLITSVLFIVRSSRTLTEMHACLEQKLLRAEQLFNRKLELKVEQSVDDEINRIQKQRAAAKIMEQGFPQSSERRSVSVNSRSGLSGLGRANITVVDALDTATPSPRLSDFPSAETQTLSNADGAAPSSTANSGSTSSSAAPGSAGGPSISGNIPTTPGSASNINNSKIRASDPLTCSPLTSPESATSLAATGGSGAPTSPTSANGGGGGGGASSTNFSNVPVPAAGVRTAAAPGLTGFSATPYDRMPSSSLECSSARNNLTAEEVLAALQDRLTKQFRRQYRREAVAMPQETLLMTFDDWAIILPDKLIEAFGGSESLMHMWMGVVESYQESSRTEAELLKRKYLLKVQDSTRRLLSSDLEKAERMESTLTQLERHLSTMLGILDARNPL